MEIRKINVWKILSHILIGLIISPIIYIIINSFKPNSDLTNHIFEYLLKEYVINTAFILIPTVFLTFIIGVGLAYFETFYDFKFRNFFRYTNFLSFAIPSYLFAYIYVDFITGPFYVFLKKHGVNMYLDIANIKGAIIMLSIAFYPYVYITSRAYMKRISMDLIYSSKLLGQSNFQTLYKVILPVSRPAIITGLMLVIMETLNAFGVPFFFGIRVFSTGIYDSWINNYDLDGANKLSVILIIIVLFFLFIEKLSRRKIKYCTGKNIKIKREKLKGIKHILVLSFFFTVFFFTLLFPIIYIFRWVYFSIGYVYIKDVLINTKNTLFILFYTAIFVLIFALFLTNVNRLSKRKWIINKLSSVGYSIPGSVIAIGFLSIFIGIDLILINSGITENMLLIKSPLILVFAYTTRFLSLAYTPIESSIEKNGNSLHESSRLLGMGKLKTFFKVDIFMQKIAIISAALLLSIEIIKELPLAALLLTKTTLSIQMKNYASDEELVLIGVPALILISITLVLICIYNHFDMKGED
ncbi:ABC transporter permease [Streptobacillus notomytis]|uniref:ABC transporter permease n=1 Tax=Streptobacillus notomytis TaxID=1712031 RepID=UPI00082B2BFC|nr:iron ABC transporter permease [Streptobacillus notomytis]